MSRPLGQRRAGLSGCTAFDSAARRSPMSVEHLWRHRRWYWLWDIMVVSSPVQFSCSLTSGETGTK